MSNIYRISKARGEDRFRVYKNETLWQVFYDRNLAETYVKQAISNARADAARRTMRVIISNEYCLLTPNRASLRLIAC